MISGSPVNGRQRAEQHHLDDDVRKEVLRVAHLTGVDHIAQSEVEDDEVAGGRQDRERKIVTQRPQHHALGQCRNCGHAYVYEAIYLGHLGRYHCPNCGQTRPAPSIAAEQIRFDGTRGAAFRLRTPEDAVDIRLPLPGLYNVYNALGAAALCLALGIDLATIAAGLHAVAAAFGRAETVSVGEAELSILLVKNPAGANEILRTLVLEPGELDLLAPHVRLATCAGTRAAELALRLKYAGVPEDRLRVVPALAEALDAAVADTPNGRVFALPTYTALLELRDELAGRGHVAQFWERAR